ncbi:MAG: phosphoenolpyruvate--protein phosphotransferase [Deltaproteobacteria bacterium]|nr:phosphoenolpyruvate--protein phosphotransferase [Deltaproteobacteria bacterium]
MADSARQQIVIQGIGVSSGITVGKVYLMGRPLERVPKYFIKESLVPQEVERFRQAVDASRRQLMGVKEEVSKREARELIHILEVHQMMLEDDMLIRETMNRIREDEVNAEWALEKVLDEIKNVFDTIDDDYLRGRKKDIHYVGERILANLLGRKIEEIGNLQEKVVVVAHDLSPADTALMARGKVLGFATDMGGKTSHTAILARSLEIPAVVGLESVTEQAQVGDTVVVDGMKGVVILNPAPEALDYYLERRKAYEVGEKQLLKLRKEPAQTLDGRPIQLLANIELIQEVPSVLEHGAEGIGLYRTEYLFMNRKDLPSEEEQLENYKVVVRKMAPYPVTIRTIDLGGDKFVSRVDIPAEMNPALGLRAIRLCLRDVPIFKAQLRAILRASAFGKLKIMFPMVCMIDEVWQARSILREAMEELKSERISFDPKVAVGIMVETPSACLLAQPLAKEVDFFSIGTNDLIQYSLAIDRQNEHVAYLYQPLHPSILKMIQMVVQAGEKQGIPVGICGEMAGEEAVFPLLLGLGLKEFSMNALSIPRIKRLVRSISLAEMEKLAQEALSLSSHTEVDAFTKSALKAAGIPEEIL